MKGPSWLDTLRGFNIIRGSSVDYMHCVLLGVCRQLFRLWLETKHRHQPWYIGNKVAQLDSRLSKIHPPDEMKRTPRSIQTTLKYWKGIIYVDARNYKNNHYCVLSS